MGFGHPAQLRPERLRKDNVAVQPDLAPGFAVLSQQCQGLTDLDWVRLTFELDPHMDDVHSLVRAIYWR